MATQYACRTCVEGCQTCVSCNGCNTCQRCNSCIVTCNSCQGTCNDCQLCDAVCQVTCEQAQVLEPEEQGCSTLGQFLKKDFHFSVCPETTTPIGPEDTLDGVAVFNQAVWQEIIDYYNEGVGLGKLVSFFQKDIAAAKKEDVSPFKAAEFNRVADAVNFQGTRPQPGDIIYGSYFKHLEAAASQMIGKTEACDKCNIACNCDNADSKACNVCQKCDSGCQVTCDNCEGCVKCNICQSCNVTCNRGVTDRGCKEIPTGCCEIA